MPPEPTPAAEYSPGTPPADTAGRLARWDREKFAIRMWDRDPTLWVARAEPEIVDRMGWLGLPERAREHLPRWDALSAELRKDAVRFLVVLGMGGSSLAPDVFARTFGPVRGFPELRVLDSTHPDAVRATRQAIDPESTVFLVSSKSGTTTEPLTFFRYFWDQLTGSGAARGRHFVAITDPGTPLETLAHEHEFRVVLSAPPDVGGRYSALTEFGLVPARLLGVDVPTLLDRASAMQAECRPSGPAARNPGLQLGAFLGENGLRGCNKVTFVTSESLRAAPSWFEQLIAESTGKSGRGLVPICGERRSASEQYRADRVLVGMALGSDERVERSIRAASKAGHPSVLLSFRDRSDLGAEFFRWEVAIASAGAVLGIHPFNQPDVQLAKDLARTAIERLSSSAANRPAPRESTRRSELSPAALPATVGDWAESVREGDYIGLQAYVAPSSDMDRALGSLQSTVESRLGVPVTVGYGPRFLHSTGQLHKGGPKNGRFVQLLDEPREDVPIPGEPFTFGQLLRAQADGDREALRQRGRTVVTIQLGSRGTLAVEEARRSIRAARPSAGARSLGRGERKVMVRRKSR